MTVRRLWLGVLIGIVVVAIGLNTVILTQTTDRYFKGYLKESYDKHLGDVTQYLENVLASDTVSLSQMEAELETHLIDPIEGIAIYSTEGRLLLSVSNNRMHRHMRDDEVVDRYAILQGSETVAFLHVSRSGALDDSLAAQAFKTQLVETSLIAFGVVLAVAIVIGIWMSGRMTRDLSETVGLADAIRDGEVTEVQPTAIAEVAAIRSALYHLKTRLNIRQVKRKAYVDQVIHQTRTPLTILKTHIEGVEDGLLEMNPEEIDVFKQQIDYLETLLADLPDFIDAEKSPDSVESAPVDVSKVLRQMCRSVALQFSQKNLELLCNCGEKSVVASDEHLIKETLYNLLNNAYKYTPAGGRVTVSCKGLSGGAVVEILDTGVGIPETALPNIFTPYFRAENAQAITGEGIGLYVVKENMVTLGGDVRVDSEMGKGTRVTLTFTDLSEDDR